MFKFFYECQRQQDKSNKFSKLLIPIAIKKHVYFNPNP